MATSEPQELRPAVIGRKSFSYLDELRRFRHLVRNVYTMNLSAVRMEPLIVGLFDNWAQLRSELFAFAEFLEMLAEVDEDALS